MTAIDLFVILNRCRGTMFMHLTTRVDQFNHMFLEKLDHHALIKIVRIRIVAAHLATWKLRNLWDVETGCWNALVVTRFKWTVNCTVIKIWSRLRGERKVVKTKLSKRIHSERARKLPECRFFCPVHWNYTASLHERSKRLQMNLIISLSRVGLKHLMLPNSWWTYNKHCLIMFR